MKYIYLIAISFMLTSHLYSQNTLGWKAGFSVPSMTGTTENVDNYTSKLNFNAGIVFRKVLKNDWSLKMELNYAPQSATRNGMQLLNDRYDAKLEVQQGATLYASYRHSIRFTYLELPVMLQFKMGDKLKYSFCAGPHIALLLKAKSRTEGTSNIYKDEAGTQLYLAEGVLLGEKDLNADNTVTENYKKVSLGMQGGLGLEYPVLCGMAFIEMRTIISLSNMNRSSITQEKLYTGSLAVSAGYMFSLHH